MFNVFSFEYRTDYGITWKNTAQPERQQTMRARNAYSITKATYVHIQRVILIAVSLQQWVHQRDSMLRVYVKENTEWLASLRHHPSLFITAYTTMMLKLILGMELK